MAKGVSEKRLRNTIAAVLSQQPRDKRWGEILSLLGLSLACGSWLYFAAQPQLIVGLALAVGCAASFGGALWLMFSWEPSIGTIAMLVFVTTGVALYWWQTSLALNLPKWPTPHLPPYVASVAKRTPQNAPTVGAQSESILPASIRLVIDCESELLPVNIQHQEMYLLIPFPKHSDLVKYFKKAGVFGLWPSSDVYPPELVERCELESFGDAIIIDAVLTATITFARVEHNPQPEHGLRLTAVIMAIQNPRFDIPIISATRRFEFYIQNTGEYGVDIAWVPNVTIGDKTVPLDVTNRSRLIRMFPNESAVP